MKLDCVWDMCISSRLNMHRDMVLAIIRLDSDGTFRFLCKNSQLPILPALALYTYSFGFPYAAINFCASSKIRLGLQ